MSQSHSFNLSMVKVIISWYSSTGCTCYLHRCISYFNCLAGSEANIQQWQKVKTSGVQSQVESDQRFKKWFLIPYFLTLSIIRYVSRVKWSNPGKAVAPSLTPQCSSYLFIPWCREKGFMPFLRALVWSEIQSATWNIWTHVASSISYVNSHSRNSCYNSSLEWYWWFYFEKNEGFY